MSNSMYHNRGTGSRFINHLLDLGVDIVFTEQTWNVSNFHTFPLNWGEEVKTVGDYCRSVGCALSRDYESILSASYLSYRRVVSLRKEELEIYKDFKSFF